MAGIMETGPSILECLGLPDAELPPDPPELLGQAESLDDVEAFFLLDFPDSQMEMEWRRRRPSPGEEEEA